MLPVGNNAARKAPRTARRGNAHAAPDEPVAPARDERPTARPSTAQAAAGGPRPTDQIGRQLAIESGDAVTLLHHRRTPRVKPHVDHLAISPSGVWIVHSRVAQGRVATRKPLFGEPKLTIGGRERTDLLVNLERQLGYVQLALGREYKDVVVRTGILFVDTPLPLLRTLHLGSYLFFGSESLAGHLRMDGPLTPDRIAAVARLLDERFPPVEDAE